MASFDTTLIQPTADQLDRVVRDAVRAADYRCRIRRLGWPPADYAAFQAELAGTAEGWRAWTGGSSEAPDGLASRLLVAWWTDFAGRRHCRVAAKRGNFVEGSRLLDVQRGNSPAWPPLALLDRRAFLHGRGGPSRLFALCACGEFGPPLTLGWMAGRCGPCHDRLEGGEALPPARAWMWEDEHHFVRCLAFSPDGATLAAVANQNLFLLDAGSGAVRVRHTFRHHVSSLACSPDGRTFAAGIQAAVCLLDAATAEERSRLHIEVAARDYHVWGLCFTPDGRHLLGLHGSAPFITDLRRGATLDLSGGRDVARGHNMALSPDGKTLLLSNVYHHLRFWNVPDGEERELPSWAAQQQQREWLLATAPAWSPDGRLLALVVQSARAHSPQSPPDRYRLRLWDVAEGRLRGEWPVPYAPRGWLPTFSPDGRTLVASKHHILGAWDVSCEALAELCFSGLGISDLAFSPDGRWLATGGMDRTVQLWPVEVLRAP